MPIWIRKVVGNKLENHLEIAAHSWDLREQVEALTAWLENDESLLDKGSQWVADLGFEPREGAMGGGPPLDRNLLQHCVENNLEIWLSEYPSTVDTSDIDSALLKLVREGVQGCSNAMVAAEKYLTTSAEYDLAVFGNMPNSTDYKEVLYRKELLDSMVDLGNKRLFMVCWLYELLGIEKSTVKISSDSEKERIPYLEGLIAALLSPTPNTRL